ncbi:putative cfem-domain-containing protein [Rosellinia necatrix]|uniref:Putative cfem-domain-containing protein n=1 Tax=Rosellinia necatrix TaxID=77044 RepID=A0A1W2TVV4_ROSNE|nr:putative cfem-domain-containing protein [Rosellinia necatrix]
MKYAVAALALAAAVSAQSISDIPACALPCIDDARTKQTDCAADDYKCICDNIDSLTATATPCVLSACGADTAINEVLPAVQKFCAAVEAGGEPTSEPTSGPTSEPTSEPTSGPTSEPTSTPTAEPTSTPTAEPTSEPTGEPTQEPTSTPTAEPTSEPTQEPTGYPTATSAPATTLSPTYGGGNGTATPTATPTMSPIPTAAAAIVGSIGSFAMLALGALAAF